MRKRKIKFIALFIFAGFLFFLTVSNLRVQYNNRRLKQTLTSLNAQTVALNEIVPFRWDVVYTFDPYLPKEDMEKIIGFKSSALCETVSEGMVRLVFVKGRSVVASVCGYPDVLGYYIAFDLGEGYYAKIDFKDQAVFNVEKFENVVRLSCKPFG